MDGILALASLRVNTFLFPPVTTRVGFGRRKFPVSLAAKGGGPKEEEEGEEDCRMKLDELDQMELKFGRLIGEDPKLTLAKIMAKKVDPDASFLEVEKAFYRNKGKMVEIKELPFDVPNRPKKESSSVDGLNLARPVLKKGAKFEIEDKPIPPSWKMNKPDRPSTATNTNKRSVPNVILRKPSVYVEEDVDDRLNRSSSSFRFKPNLTLKMGDRGKKTFSDMTLLRKPEPASVHEKEKSSSDGKDKIEDFGANLTAGNEDYGGFTLLKKPELRSSSEKSLVSFSDLVAEEVEVEVEEEEMRDDSVLGMQPVGNGAMESIEMDALVTKKSDATVNDSASTLSLETALLGKPKRLDQSVEETSTSSVSNAVLVGEGEGDGDYRNVSELKDFDSSSTVEDADWTRAEELLKTGSRGEVELISSSARGFVVAFGSLIGFLPYRNLAAKWKFLAFESWLRQQGLDPSLYRQNLGIIGNYDALDKITPSDLSNGAGSDKEVPKEVTVDMKLEDLLRIYDQEKHKFLASFVGQRIKVNVVMADRRLKKVIVSLRPKEKDELVEQKRNLMAKLQIGDVVRCCIKKITYFGIFVEVEGVPALIHQTEVSWDATLDPASYFKVGQIVEAKVHQLDFPLERIFLSLKEATPDPLGEALECVIGDRDSLGRLQAADADAEWAEVESLIEELQQIEGVQSVSKGRFFLSPGLAPTFQVYMASMYEDQYKLLARSGNKGQEVIVQASLSKENMKSAILSCTNRVE